MSHIDSQIWNHNGAVPWFKRPCPCTLSLRDQSKTMECLIQGCTRIANEPHRHCCSACKLSQGREHNPRCERDYRARRQNERHRLRSRSSRARRQNEAQVSNVVTTVVDAASSVSTYIPPCVICLERITCANGRTVMTNCGHLYCDDCWTRYKQTEEAKAAGEATFELRCASCRSKIEGEF